MGGRRLKTVKIEGEEPKGRKAKAKEPQEEVAEAQEVSAPADATGRSAEAASEEVEKKSKKRRVKTVGKRFQEASKLVAINKLYPLDDAIALAKKTSTTKFEATLEAHFNLSIDPEKTEQLIRTTVALPHGTGKSLKVLVFADGDAAKKAKEEGADEIGDESLIEKITSSGVVPFDAVVAIPSFMPKLAKAARILGPKGLMPNPKSQTVTDDPAKTVSELKKGRVTLQTKNEPAIHTAFGKVSFPDEHLSANFRALWDALIASKPPKVKEPFVKSVYIATTMGPSIKLDLSSLTSS